MQSQTATQSVSLDSAELGDVVDELIERLKRGEPVDAEYLAATYPEAASSIEQMLPTIRCLVDLSQTGPAGLGEKMLVGADFWSEQPLGDYRLVRQIGRGGMGMVYEAEQLSLSRRVALKILPLAAVLDPRTLQRFKNEAQAAASLDHPHIVDVYGVGCERGVHYYAMRLINGCTLADVIDELRKQETGDRNQEPVSSGQEPGETDASYITNPKSQIQNLKSASTSPLALLSTVRTAKKSAFFRIVAELGIHVAEGLSHAHEQGIVHRDIKPSNLMLDGQGKVWITDFGLAHIEANQSLTMTGDLLGTLRYMSPEQALAKRVPVDQRSDIYSLGATLYELVALAPVFGEADRATLLHRIAFSDPKPPRQLNPSIPADLETILLKMLEKDPGSRYSSAGELAADLHRFVENQPIHARRRSWSQHVAKWSARNRPLVLAIAGMLLAMTAAIGGLLGWQARDAAARTRLADELATSALTAAAAHEAHDDWPRARGEIKRAESALAGQSASKSPLFEHVQTRLRDADLAVELDGIRLLAATTTDDDFDFAAANDAYNKAFVRYGLDLAHLPRKQSILRIERSPIREVLADALTNWSIVRRRMGGDQSPGWRDLLSLADESDPDPWRNRVRQVYRPPGIDAGELTEFVLSAQVEKMPRATLFLLVQAAGNQRLGGAPVVARLRESQRQHADDFWINFALARFFEQTQPADFDKAVRYYSVALALRPGTAAVHSNLGRALHLSGQRGEAIVEYRRAVAVEPRFAVAYSNLGCALCEEGSHAEAEIVLRQALALGGKWAELQCNLGAALSGQRKFDEAIAAYRQALETEPNHRSSQRGLQSCLERQRLADNAGTAAH